MTIVYAIIIFCMLIFVHELGHFIAAKSTGIRVNKFAIGMGPILLKKQAGETEYSIRLLPIGGFCSMEGEDGESEDKKSFSNKGFWAKAVVLMAGSGMNLIFTIILFTGIVFALGVPSTIMGEIAKDSPAEVAGMLPGDKIISVQGQKTDSWESIVTEITGAGEEKISIEIERNNQITTINPEPKVDESGRLIIGITPERKSDLITSIKMGIVTTGQLTKELFKVIGQLLTGNASVKDLTGPVGIVSVVGDTVELGLVYVAQFTAFISLNLAIMNLLPFPALDGGRMILLIINKLTGKAISEEVESKIHFAGIILLFGLMIFVTFQDVSKLILN